MNDIVKQAGPLIDKAREACQAAKIVASVANDPALVVAAAKAALDEINRVRVEVDAIRARTGLISRLERALIDAEATLIKPFHEHHLEETPIGRHAAASSLSYRLDNARRYIQEELDSDRI